ncbi:hypothetical protein SEA_BAXTERFOX_52 [Gordonia phage BaxterFox]|uniref:Uncharacterized protein n=2 Tax=Nymbaxtervirinae TaxID=2169601 RepID=A0A514A344_9CAUD|nr:hypothetical protein SEA_BAXTERFOX_52 [Gordonia phage BaxterFox]YP_010652673.1 hypothetical protein PP484_gp61 [Gordonia phage Madeline]AMS03862.1 hypothetical protein SEA_BAXTERFOX_52 [Gordonia phage BaxterFox]QDH47652.1 hypothetical protein SEA_MADELINE_49 [Gordonia phage Madeline]
MSDREFRAQLVHETTRLQPVALQIVDSVHSSGDDAGARFLDAVAEAEEVGGPMWRTSLLMVLAALVPQDRSIHSLIAWAQEDAA